MDTTATALTCLILILLQNQDLQTRMQEEINGVFPEGVFPSLSKRQQTPFTEAVILELLRYISHVPLAVPHSTLENATICGYHIDAMATVFFHVFIYIFIYHICNTNKVNPLQCFNFQIYINLWALHHDERIWPDPWKFDPGRFLDNDGAILSPLHPKRKR